MPPSSQYEQNAISMGARLVAGIDEAGRGPLAGPVVAAAVILENYSDIPGLNDSKLLKEKTRSLLFEAILSSAKGIGIGIIGPGEIDRVNILQATRLAMKLAVIDLKMDPDFLLIDGPIRLDLDCAQRPIIKGDKLSLSIAAASIVAKVTRDRIMEDLDEEFPNYGFKKNKGYGTKEHQQAIEIYGPCRVHRMSFKLLPYPIQKSMF
ncbi:MAG: ribonuclease HII [Desulfomonilaceae bacterium]